MAPDFRTGQRSGPTRCEATVTQAHERDATRTARYGYFVVQTQAVHEGAAVRLSGVLEDLGTGEKHPFSDGDGLARLVTEWAARSGVPP